MNELGISIISPVFNAEKYIEQTILSVLASKIYLPFEYIVINDGSTDNSLNIIKKYSEKIVILNQTNLGEAKTVNRGINMAKYDFILILNADDPLLDPKLIDIALKKLSENNELVAVYPDWQIIDESGNLIRKVLVPDYSLDLLVSKCICLPGPGTVFRKSSALSIGGRNPKWKYVGDYDFWLRLSQVGKFQHINQNLAQWRLHQKSTSISNRNINMANERIEVISQFLDRYKLSNKLKKASKANALYLAARLVFFDRKIPAKRMLFRAILIQKKFPSNSKLLVVIFILTTPLSHLIKRLIPLNLFGKIENLYL